MQKLALLKQKQDESNKAFARGDVSTAEYKKIEIAVMKAENELKGLNNEMAKTQNMSVQQTAAGFDKLTGNLNKVQSAASALSKVALGIVTALGAAAVAFITIGDELDDTSKKFRVSAEKMQDSGDSFLTIVHKYKHQAITMTAADMSKIAVEQQNDRVCPKACCR